MLLLYILAESQWIQPAITINIPDSRNAQTPLKEQLNGDELFICMDSNSKYLKRNMIWDTHTTFWKYTPNIHKARHAILGSSTTPQCLLIHTGVNDTGNKAAHQVANELLELVANIRKQFRNMRIVLSEIFQRNDRVDSVVVEARGAFHTQVTTQNVNLTLWVGGWV